MVQGGNFSYKVADLEDKLADIDTEFCKNPVDTETLLVQLTEFKTEIDNFEEGQHLTYCYYRMQYHVTMKQLYFHCGNEEDSTKHQRLCFRYLRRFEEVSPEPENQSLSPSNETNIEQEFKIIDKNTIINRADDDLIQLLDALKPDIDEDLYNIVFHLLQSISRRFSNLQNFIAVRKYHYDVVRAFNEFKLGLIQQIEKLQENNQQSDVNEDERKELLENCNKLLILECNLRESLQNKLNQRAVEVMELSLSDEAALRSSMFDIVELTERNITNRFRLFCQFHPDRFLNCPNNDVFKRFFQILCSERERALNRLQSKIGSTDPNQHFRYHKEVGDRYWRLFVDWQEASKCNYSNCKILKKEDYENLTLQQRIDNKINFAKSCYQQYRAACKIIDALALEYKQKAEYENYQYQQIEIRKFIAVALHAAQMPFESQLYAIGALHILHTTTNVTQEQIKQIRNILAKSKSINTHKENVKQQSESSSQDNNNNRTNRNPINSTYVAVYNENAKSNRSSAPVNSPTVRKQHASYVRQDITKLVIKELILPQQNLICYNSPDEPILLARRQAAISRLHGGATQAVGVTSILASGLVIVSQAEAFTVVPLLGTLATPVGIATSLIHLINGFIGFKFGWDKIKEGNDLLKEPQIRENLNKIITNAVIAYSNKKFQEFFEHLSKNYAVDSDKNSKCLIQYIKDTKIKVQSDKLIDELLSYEFRPDDIAFLLVIIGEALMRCNITISKTADSSKREIASDLFEQVFENEKLRKEAERIDKAVDKSTKFNRSDLAKIPGLGKLSRMMFYSYYSIPESYLKDSVKSPFTQRLQEITILARLNYALVRIIIGEDDNLEIAKEQVVNARNIITKNFQFFSIAEYRLSTVEDLLSAIGQDPSLDTNYDNNIKSIKYITTDIQDLTDNSKFSFVTELDQNVDM